MHLIIPIMEGHFEQYQTKKQCKSHHNAPPDEKNPDAPKNIEAISYCRIKHNYGKRGKQCLSGCQLAELFSGKNFNLHFAFGHPQYKGFHCKTFHFGKGMTYQDHSANA